MCWWSIYIAWPSQSSLLSLRSLTFVDQFSRWLHLLPHISNRHITWLWERQNTWHMLKVNKRRQHNVLLYASKRYGARRRASRKCEKASAVFFTSISASPFNDRASTFRESRLRAYTAQTKWIYHVTYVDQEAVGLGSRPGIAAQ